MVTVFVAQAVGLLLTLGLLVLSSEPMPDVAVLVWAALAGLGGVAGVGFFYVALSRGPMGLVAPLTALLGAAIPAVVGVFNGEAATPLLITGMVVALAAVVLISIPYGEVGGETSGPPSDAPFGEPADPHLAAQAGHHRNIRVSDLTFIVLAGLGFAGFFLGIDQAYHAGGQTFWPMVMVRVAGVAVGSVLVAVLVFRRGKTSLRVPRAVMPALAAAGIGDIGGNLFFVMARASGSLPVAVVLASLYPVVTALLARIFLGERLRGVRIVGVGAAVVGVILIAIGQA